MALSERLDKLGKAARRLNESSDQLVVLVRAIDSVLGRLNLEVDYVDPRPLDEASSTDSHGKRTIELSLLGYLEIDGRYQLALKTVKVHESKVAMSDSNRGSLTPLLDAPRKILHAAVDHLPALVGALSQQVWDLVNQVERRCKLARDLLADLESLEVMTSGVWPVPDPDG
ncbi:MAG: hypothetical protein ACPG77_05725 [Nannocystaceae bacterium]